MLSTFWLKKPSTCEGFSSGRLALRFASSQYALCDSCKLSQSSLSSSRGLTQSSNSVCQLWFTVIKAVTKHTREIFTAMVSSSQLSKENVGPKCVHTALLFPIFPMLDSIVLNFISSLACIQRQKGKEHASLMTWWLQPLLFNHTQLPFPAIFCR